jgi:hypothetical protein
VTKGYAFLEPLTADMHERQKPTDTFVETLLAKELKVLCLFSREAA